MLSERGAAAAGPKKKKKKGKTWPKRAAANQTDDGRSPVSAATVAVGPTSVIDPQFKRFRSKKHKRETSNTTSEPSMRHKMKRPLSHARTAAEDETNPNVKAPFVAVVVPAAASARDDTNDVGSPVHGPKARVEEPPQFHLGREQASSPKAPQTPGAHHRASQATAAADDIQQEPPVKEAVNREDDHVSSALLMAVDEGYEGILQLLLKTGVDLDRARDENGLSPLTLAAWHGRTAIGTLLIDAGADVNQPDSNGDTALKNAAGRDHREVAMMLIKRGASTRAGGIEVSALHNLTEWMAEEMKGKDQAIKEKDETIQGLWQRVPTRCPPSPATADDESVGDEQQQNGRVGNGKRKAQDNDEA